MLQTRLDGASEGGLVHLRNRFEKTFDIGINSWKGERIDYGYGYRV